jgi:hypothetical protein
LVAILPGLGIFTKAVAASFTKVFTGKEKTKDVLGEVVV